MAKSGRLTTNVMKVVKWMEDDRQSRSHSWVHCRQAFLHRTSLREKELALHLAFYLASWGMYRGASFLLQKDFTIHLPAVRVLLSAEFNTLWHAADEDAMDLAFKLAKDIRSAYLYAAHVDNSQGGPKKIVTDILVTKVLLGSVCCTPAFDTFVVAALRKRHMVQQFSRQGMCGIYSLYQNNREEFT
jgi:hypothetical protein